MMNRSQIRILEAARGLFWKYGFRKVTVEEICRAAGISKMTYYRFYPNKHKVAMAVMDKVVHDSMVAFREILEADIPLQEKIGQMIRMKYEGVHEIGTEFIRDFYNQDELGLGEYMMKITGQSYHEMKVLMHVAMEKGVFRKDLDLDIFFMVSRKMVELTRDESFMQRFRSPDEMVMALTNILVYGICPHENVK
ncbi:MAG TPA: TetR/AcrR family transcriptional regulator [Bacteroidales bacterium]|nr:TetR/AcrR family transcriptional regulator [Bacteroidales bacterium]HRZ48798.1 TetR/AcrR family transcriptional regulator [Bacteroidales bacterium]